jgi:hypothetical protein
MKTKQTGNNSAIGRRIVARNALDNLPEGTVVPANATGIITRVEHHETDPYTRYTVRFDDGGHGTGMIIGRDIKIA